MDCNIKEGTAKSCEGYFKSLSFLIKNYLEIKNFKLEILASLFYLLSPLNKYVHKNKR